MIEKLNMKNTEIKQINVTRTTDFKPEESLQQQQILSKSANKEVFIIVIEDPTNKPVYRTYVAPKLTTTSDVVKFMGYEVTKQYSKLLIELKNTNISYSDAIEIAKKFSQDLESLDIPWHKIIRVKTIKFAENK